MIDQNNPVSREYRAHFEARLARLRVQLEADIPPEKTAALRGRIAELKKLLEWKGEQEPE